jgi:hypothetical protein
MLSRLLGLHRSRGFQFVTLPEAERDKFYGEDTDLHLSPGPDSLEGSMIERRLPLPAMPWPPHRLTRCAAEQGGRALAQVFSETVG